MDKCDATYPIGQCDDMYLNVSESALCYHLLAGSFWNFICRSLLHETRLLICFVTPCTLPLVDKRASCTYKETSPWTPCWSKPPCKLREASIGRSFPTVCPLRSLLAWTTELIWFLAQLPWLILVWSVQLCSLCVALSMTQGRLQLLRDVSRLLFASGATGEPLQKP